MYESIKKYMKEEVEKGRDIYNLYQRAGHAFVSTTTFFASWNNVIYFAMGQMPVVDLDNRRYLINCMEYSSIAEIPLNTDKFFDTVCNMEKDLKISIGNEDKIIYVRTPLTFVIDVLNRRMALWCMVGFREDNDEGMPIMELPGGWFRDNNSSSIKPIDSAKTIEWLERWARR